jgi:hypothetical protein
LGDVVDLPIQNSMTANMHQIRCVTQNALNYLGAKTMTGKYQGESGIKMFTGISRMNTYWAKKGQESISMENEIVENVVYYLNAKFGGKGATKIFKGKSDGIGKVYTLMNGYKKAVSTGAEPRFVADH